MIYGFTLCHLLIDLERCTSDIIYWAFGLGIWYSYCPTTVDKLLAFEWLLSHHIRYFYVDILSRLGILECL